MYGAVRKSYLNRFSKAGAALVNTIKQLDYEPELPMSE